MGERLITDLLDTDRTSITETGMTPEEVTLLEYALMTEHTAFYINTSPRPEYELVGLYNQTEPKEATYGTNGLHTTRR